MSQYELNGRTFSFGTIPPVEAIKVEVAIARVIGEPLFKAFMEQKPAKGADPEQVKRDTEAAGSAALGLILSKMDADELTATMETVFKYVSVNGQRVVIDQHFMGKNKELWQVFFRALSHNFADFLPAGLFDSIRKGMPASS